MEFTLEQLEPRALALPVSLSASVAGLNLFHYEHALPQLSLHSSQTRCCALHTNPAALLLSPPPLLHKWQKWKFLTYRKPVCL